MGKNYWYNNCNEIDNLVIFVCESYFIFMKHYCIYILYISDIPYINLETDSEEEEEREIQRKKKQTAQRHWGTIRRDVNDKIRVRKGNNVAGMSWNILRHQVRAQTQAEAVRLELYVKYGVVKPSANVQPIDKPTLSETAQQLIAVFENLEVKNIDDNVFSAAKISKFTEEKTQS